MNLLRISCQKHFAAKWINWTNQPVCLPPCEKAMCSYTILFMHFHRLSVYCGRLLVTQKYWQSSKRCIGQAPIQKSSKHLLLLRVMAKKSPLSSSCEHVSMKRLILRLPITYKKRALSWSMVSSVIRPMPN